MNQTSVILRPFDANHDEAFIYATWLRNSFYGLPKPRPTGKSKDAWYKEKALYIHDMISQSNIHVATLAGDPFVILGYAVIGGGRIIWLYVKEAYRDEGLDTLLETKLKESYEERSEASRSASEAPRPF